MASKAQFIQEAAQHGGFKRAMAEAAAATAEAWCKADSGNRRLFQELLSNGMRDYLRDVCGWNASEAADNAHKATHRYAQSKL